MPTHPEAPAAERVPRVPVAASSERGSGLGGAHASGVLFSASRRKPRHTNLSPVFQPTMSVERWFGRDARTRTRDACAPRSPSARREIPSFARPPRFQPAAGHRPALRPGARASARFTARTFVASKTNSTVTNLRPLKRRERRAPFAASRVAQVSQPAVSPISKSAGRPAFRPARGFGNPRHSRLGSPRYGHGAASSERGSS